MRDRERLSPDVVVSIHLSAFVIFQSTDWEPVTSQRRFTGFAGLTAPLFHGSIPPAGTKHFSKGHAHTVIINRFHYHSYNVSSFVSL